MSRVNSEGPGVSTGSIQGYSGVIPRLFRGQSRVIPKPFRGRGQSGVIPRSIRACSGVIPGLFRGHSGIVSTGIIPGSFGGHSSAPLTFEYSGSRGFLRASGEFKVETFNFRFLARRLLAYFRQGWRCRLGCREATYIFL